MAEPARDEAREERMMMEIVVDAYRPGRAGHGCYYYLEGQLRFPLLAHCIAKRAISPPRIGDEVEVVGMAPEEECEHEMFMLMPWERRALAVPLFQLKVGSHVNEETRQALEDWHYWFKRGYEFG